MEFFSGNKKDTQTPTAKIADGMLMVLKIVLRFFIRFQQCHHNQRKSRHNFIFTMGSRFSCYTETVKIFFIFIAKTALNGKASDAFACFFFVASLDLFC